MLSGWVDLLLRTRALGLMRNGMLGALCPGRRSGPLKTTKTTNLRDSWKAVGAQLSLTCSITIIAQTCLGVTFVSEKYPVIQVGEKESVYEPAM